MENILELNQVSKAYPKSDFTLDSLSLSLPYGAILGFVGGKTEPERPPPSTAF